ncbi:alpha/beta hydrolase [Pseudonocardia kujensis]|uniref:alpha/beta fold hydrolase n=1 Tax=Pseudonocardia kujensis TaxID=1128675 RepID=UPI001E29205F|nr:alpha/beta hydrolase [Pseudonocardia kujensis]MCE0765391.1 alpha/beta hydrolase [Pseudonocardia kujensis]
MSQAMDRVSVNGVELEVAVEGSGETVVFVHGAGIADSYLPVAIDPAVRGHYRTVRYRRRGYGGSSPVQGAVAVSEHVSDCRALLAELGVRQAHVVGQSYGGVIALQLAIDAPEVVATLALFEPALLAVPSGPRFFEQVAPVFQMYERGDRVAAVDAFMTAVGDSHWRENVERTVPGGVEQAETDAATLFESDLASLGAWELTAEQVATLRQPVLYVLGSRTLPVIREGRDLLRAWLLRMDDVVLDGATHFLQMEQPSAAAAALADFLKRHPAAV